MVKKEKLYITGIWVHTREFHQTVNFSKVAEKGRMYSPMPPVSVSQKISDSEISNKPSSDGKFKFIIKLPDDLQEKINRGEIDVMIPISGLFVFPGKDAVEKAKQLEEKARNELIHNSSKWQGK